ncbi:hypothetical protein F511_10139 [Dorcoceras hygrometricum]|uniref:Uncharacterized protein n=1 Tax=Dorcoceras hygrometricum TaxID=472368 RepID=A0A2Z7ABH5_9LAMI|nr:hypothetical protein F511_10139 [Dorcoceras hygrometricum]
MQPSRHDIAGAAAGDGGAATTKKLAAAVREAARLSGSSALDSVRPASPSARGRGAVASAVVGQRHAHQQRHRAAIIGDVRQHVRNHPGNTGSDTTVGDPARQRKNIKQIAVDYRQSGPRPDPRLLRQAALEALTRSARTNTPRKTRPEQFPAKIVGGGGDVS